MTTTTIPQEARHSTREARGLEIYRRGGIDRISRGVFLVPSCTRRGVDYLVDLERQSCECRDHHRTGGPCKHVYGAMLFQAWLRRTARALSFALASPDEE